MFEITYNDSDTLQNFIDADKAYHGAIYDFTFEGRFIVYLSLSKTPHGMSPWTA